MRKLICQALVFCAAVSVVAQQKAVITVLDFQVNNIAEGDMRSIISLLSSALFQTGAFKVIDVSQRNTILKELEFSQGDCTDESCQLEIGKLLSAEMIVVGNLGQVGRRFLISTKILETETGNTLSSADGIYQDLESLIDDIYAFATKLAGIGAEGPAEEVAAAEEPAAQPPPAEAAGAPAEERPPAEPEPAAEAPTQEEAAEAPPPATEPEPRQPGPPGKRIAASATLAGGAVAFTGGAVVVVLAQRMRSVTIPDAYNTYLDAQYIYEERNPGESFFALTESARQAFLDELYSVYEERLERYKYVMIGGVIAGGLGVVLAGTSVLLFLLPDRPATALGAASPRRRLQVIPTVGTTGGLGFRLRVQY